MIPEGFQRKMKALLAEEGEAFLASHQELPCCGLRVNTEKIDPQALAAELPFALTPVPWCSEGFAFAPEQRPGKHPCFYAGLYYLQEPSAMAPVALLPIRPEDRVLDLCAAPGGKTTFLAAKLQGKGFLLSNDISPSRAKAVVKNVERMGFTNTIVTSEEPAKLRQKLGAYFDKILLDAPCSGEGMFRRDPDAAKAWTKERIETCLRTQETLLEEADGLLKQGGLLLYSTCTFSPEENEGQIAAFLRRHPEYRLLPIQAEGISPGRPDWVKDGGEELSLCGRIWPHRAPGEGHFLALLEKTGPAADCTAKPFQPKLPKALAAYRDFEQETLTTVRDGLFYEIDGALYCLPLLAPDLSGIRVLRSGLLLGEDKRGRFIPSQALALALGLKEARCYADFLAEDERAIRYLKGETVSWDGPTGYCLVGWHGFPLGWAKSQNGRLKNQYARGWRME
ncbi:MAG TPA: RsmB/NOP family class I SAM-dependent RNA methyltransferase [Firmicutes bacterium]|nr:RsmB/NOP family class I SAM-dependent RNA methyltransferase [Bacillota bacterium]